MSVYQMEDGTVVNTEKASKKYTEATYHDGRNCISCATGDQWVHETLYRSRKGRYYVEHWSQWQGSHPHAEWVSPEEATRWLLKNNYTLPEELEQFREAIEE